MEKDEKKAEPTQTPNVGANKPVTEAEAPAVSVKETSAAVNDRIFASPLARKLAEEKGLELDKITGTGPNGRITKDDVLAYKAAPAVHAPTKVSVNATPILSGAFTDIPLTNMRKVIPIFIIENQFNR